ncbi:hypothetical protein ACIQ6Y_32540 [Streptomyces sp. NPDC096205]|uniref:hypothetical protein n=1 Tax=Streptomyces sp. NPDC096205 TaxID=3366081 RepID=UPI003825F2AD
MEIFEDDSEPSFERWLVGRMEGLAPGIRSEAERWTRALREGGPQPPATEGHGLAPPKRVRPALLKWSNRYQHLGEVTRDDVLAHMKSVDGHHRHDLFVALRSLFTRAKRNGLIFRNPTSRIKVGQYEYAVLQPLLPEQVERSVAVATTPAARLILALPAVHAAQVAQIATLMLDDVDLGNRRLAIAGRVRPLDDLTPKLLTDWLDHRRHRWPSTANLHLLNNNQTANTTSRASNHWISAPMRGQDATLERLRVDRSSKKPWPTGPTRSTSPRCSGSMRRQQCATRTPHWRCCTRPLNSSFDETCSTGTLPEGNHGRVTSTEAAAIVLQDHAALWSVGEISASDVVNAACDALVAGLDTPGLRILAACTRAEADYDVHDLLPPALDELGLTFHPVASEAGQEAAARALARRMLAGELKPWELTFRIHQRYGHELPLTERLAELDDEYAILEYGDRTVDQVDAEVTAEARRLAAHPCVPTEPHGHPN